MTASAGPIWMKHRRKSPNTLLNDEWLMAHPRFLLKG